MEFMELQCKTFGVIQQVSKAVDNKTIVLSLKYNTNAIVLTEQEAKELIATIEELQSPESAENARH